jgi:hypothetical protein
VGAFFLVVFSKNIRAALIVLRATITLPDGCQSMKDGRRFVSAGEEIATNPALDNWAV